MIRSYRVSYKKNGTKNKVDFSSRAQAEICSLHIEDLKPEISVNSNSAHLSHEEYHALSVNKFQDL